MGVVIFMVTAGISNARRKHPQGGDAISAGQQSCQRLCSEFRLRQGFRLRRKRLHNANAPPRSAGFQPIFPSFLSAQGKNGNRCGYPRSDLLFDLRNTTGRLRFDHSKALLRKKHLVPRALSSLKSVVWIERLGCDRYDESRDALNPQGLFSG